VVKGEKLERIEEESKVDGENWDILKFLQLFSEDLC
jgi:hypothetical protein